MCSDEQYGQYQEPSSCKESAVAFGTAHLRRLTEETEEKRENIRLRN
jgi:hypothetical protein